MLPWHLMFQTWGKISVSFKRRKFDLHYVEEGMSKPGLSHLKTERDLVIPHHAQPANEGQIVDREGPVR